MSSKGEPSLRNNTDGADQILTPHSNHRRQSNLEMIEDVEEVGAVRATLDGKDDRANGS